jgi:hypothetical protein
MPADHLDMAGDILQDNLHRYWSRRRIRRDFVMRELDQASAGITPCRWPPLSSIDDSKSQATAPHFCHRQLS